MHVPILSNKQYCSSLSGKGNTAFEVADWINGVTNLVHMVGKSRMRLSWETHYVGDLRYKING